MATRPSTESSFCSCRVACACIGGALLGAALSFVVNCTLVEISLNPFFSFYFGLLFLVGLVVSGLRALLALVLAPFGRSARAKAAARSKRITAVGAARSGPMKKSEKVEYGAKKSKKSESYRKQGEYGAKKFIKGATPAL